jgi:hypothetical protein
MAIGSGATRGGGFGDGTRGGGNNSFSGGDREGNREGQFVPVNSNVPPLTVEEEEQLSVFQQAGLLQSVAATGASNAEIAGVRDMIARLQNGAGGAFSPQGDFQSRTPFQREGNFNQGSFTPEGAFQNRSPFSAQGDFQDRTPFQSEGNFAGEDQSAFTTAGLQGLQGVQQGSTASGFGQRLDDIIGGNQFQGLVDERQRAVQGQLSAGGLTRSGAAIDAASAIPADLALQLEGQLFNRQAGLAESGRLSEGAALNRNFQGQSNVDSRNFQGSNLEADRVFRGQDAVDSRNFQGQQAMADRDFQGQLAIDNRNFQAQQNLDSRNFQGQQNVDQRNFAGQDAFAARTDAGQRDINELNFVGSQGDRARDQGLNDQIAALLGGIGGFNAQGIRDSAEAEAGGILGEEGFNLQRQQAQDQNRNDTLSTLGAGVGSYFGGPIGGAIGGAVGGIFKGL